VQRFNAQVDLVKSGGDAFEISRDGTLVFSKLKLDRFPTEAEIDTLAKT
jgi:hypothetical protein